MKIVHVVGARPNFMKIAPILREIKNEPAIHNILLHTGQHYDPNLSDVFFDELGLPQPDINLEVGSASHAIQTAQIMERFEPVLLSEKPDLILVVGDVNSTLACSLVAAKLNIPVAHVEAGVRSFDRTMPEEINRIVTDMLSELLFTPSINANNNLLKQGIPAEKIYFVGNVMVDSLLNALQIARDRPILQRWGLMPGGFAVLTLHRASNVDDQETLSQLLAIVTQVSKRLPVIFPVHPRTSRRLSDSGLDNLIQSASDLILCEPLGYLDFLCLMANARVVLTDSGGIQAETTILGVPCLTLRSTTEWPETIDQG
ncbi:MAG TPA: UDP-N-acetylglucosamine 2-epimerase (non-hydrolyzing), partial [Anaerolineales bacterium]|nr:UDP-N-acetylglucosamine 2-epimerase (non-hydrolyzing) [Anaerolineales bacterium]